MRFNTAFLALILLFYGVSSAHSQETLLLVTEEWPPFRINDNTKPYGLSGIDIEVIKEIEARSGVRIMIQIHPWVRSLELMRSGQADLMSGLAYTKSRAEYCEYIGNPYTSVRPVFYTRRGNGHLYKKYDDLYGKSIGETRASFYFEPYNSDIKLDKIRFADEEQLLHMLSLGRIDLAVGTEPNISWDISRFGFFGSVQQTYYVPESRTDLYFAFSKKSGHIGKKDIIQDALESMISDGTVENILKKYRY